MAIFLFSITQTFKVKIFMAGYQRHIIGTSIDCKRLLDCRLLAPLSDKSFPQDAAKYHYKLF